MKNQIVTAVEKHRQTILDTLNYIWANPETGYREWKTHKYMTEAFEALGYTLTPAGDIPGFITVVDTGRPGPEVLVMGELDSLICPEHPESDPETGAVHCCGHAAQAAALVGIAAALKEPGMLDELSGRIRLCAVPAEEMIEIEYRSELIDQGRIHCMGGKPEFLYRGLFDGVDLAFMVHTSNGESFAVRKGSVGCIAKQVHYKGVSSHAGGSPWSGRNALYAATQGITAANALRETFKEADIIRFHPIITTGGGAVNAIPDRVIIESYVRGKTFDGIASANKRLNQALCGAALSIDTNVDICDTPGYAPLNNSDAMMDLTVSAAEMMGFPINRKEIYGSGSTDMGDISCVMPAVHPYAPGASGTSHGSDYRIADPEKACVQSAQWQVAMLYLLLKDGAALATKIKDEFEPMFPSKEAYFAYVGQFSRKGDRITYNEDGTATVSL